MEFPIHTYPQQGPHAFALLSDNSLCRRHAHFGRACFYFMRRTRLPLTKDLCSVLGTVHAVPQHRHVHSLTQITQAPNFSGCFSNKRDAGQPSDAPFSFSKTFTSATHESALWSFPASRLPCAPHASSMFSPQLGQCVPAPYPRCLPQKGQRQSQRQSARYPKTSTIATRDIPALFVT